MFFASEGLERSLENYPRQKLGEEIANPHVTFVYSPEEVPAMLFGQRVTIRATGYGCNGENEAVQVEFVNLPDCLKPYTRVIAIPHITLSVAESAKAVNSGHLDFKPIIPFSLEGVFGGMDEAGTVHTESFL